MLKLGNIFLVGPMGAGKSTIGRLLAKELSMQFFDSDEVIEDRTGADIAWIFDIEGETGFRKREQLVIDELTQKNDIILATGGGVVLSPENRAALAGRGTVVYLKTSLDAQLDRTRHDTRRPLLQTENVENKLRELWSEREPLYNELADLSFDTDDYSAKVLTNQIISKLNQLTF